MSNQPPTTKPESEIWRQGFGDWPIAAALLVMLLYGGFVSLYLYKANWDPSRLIVAGDYFVEMAEAPESLRILKNSYGYDGQFVYRFALDPFTDEQTKFGITIDSPAYRHQRVMLPLLAWVLSGGNTGLVTWAILLVNIVCVGFVAFAGGTLARSVQLHSLTGVVIALYPGMLLSMARSLTEITAIGFVCLSLVLYQRKSWMAAGIMLSIAVLARETSIIFAAAIGLAWLAAWRRPQEFRIAWVVYALPLATFILWQYWLYSNWGASPLFMQRSGRLVAPFTAFWQFWQESFEFRHSYQVVFFLECLYLALLGLMTLLALRSPAPVALRLAWLVFAVIAFSLGHGVWVEDWSYLRVMTDYGVFALLILLYARSWLRYPAYVVTVLTWGLVCAHVVLYR